GTGLDVPLWILGSSLFGARLAAMLGLPYAFASHFAPAALMDALAVYRREFRPSAQLDKPYAIAGVNVLAADSDGEARRLFTSVQQQFANLVRGVPGQLAPPIADIDAYWSPVEKAHASAMLACSFVGEPGRVADELGAFVARTGVDEVMIATAVDDHRARLRSYELPAPLVDWPGSRARPGAVAGGRRRGLDSRQSHPPEIPHEKITERPRPSVPAGAAAVGRRAAN